MRTLIQEPPAEKPKEAWGECDECPGLGNLTWNAKRKAWLCELCAKRVKAQDAP